MVQFSHEILGIGNPFVDLILKISEEKLAQLPGGKGGMVPVDYPSFLQIVENSDQKPHFVFGGSCANTIRGLAYFGRRCALIGKVGVDDAGARFLAHLEELNIKPLLVQSSTPTAQVACLVTPDRERTMRSFLGASREMSFRDLDPAAFSGVKLVHIEGYNLVNEQVVQRGMQLAKEAGAFVSFDIGSYELAQARREEILGLLNDYVDIVFANQMELHALTHLPPVEGCAILKKKCQVVVVLLGAEGCLVGYKDKIVHVPAFLVDPLDTTGAGDLFASGFLHAFLDDCSLEECARLGARSGAAIVQVHGVNLDKWQKFLQKFPYS